MDIGHLISDSSAFSTSSLYIWKFLVHVLLKVILKDFEHYLATLWNEHNCVVVWAFFGNALFWDWNENWPFLVLWPLLSFPDLLTLVQHFNSVSSFRILNSSAEIPSRPLAFLIVMLPKAHLTSHSRMFGSRWVTTPLLLSGSLRPFWECHGNLWIYYWSVKSVGGTPGLVTGISNGDSIIGDCTLKPVESASTSG